MKEEEIRQRDTFNRYLELVEKDAKNFFDPGTFITIACPACGGKDNVFEFEKTGFNYVSCKKCHTLFANPRPSFGSLNDFYSDSESTSFWIDKFFGPVAEARRQKIFAPRARYIAETLKFGENWLVGDSGAGFGFFLEEIRKMFPGNRLIAIEPSHKMAGICRDKGLETKEMCVEEITDINGAFDLLTAFELTEHLFDPASFFIKARSLLKRGGYLYITTLNGMGFDIMLLWKRSKSIAPPHHLNFFNPGSIRQLLEKAGFEILEISTPGELDWDIVEGMIKNEGVKLDRFWNALADKGSEESKKTLQKWIAKNNLSAHMRIVAKKP